MAVSRLSIGISMAHGLTFQVQKMMGIHCRRHLCLSAKSVTPITIQQDQKDLPMRRMQDSYQEVIIPLGQDYQVREKYITFMKGLRFGRIMEDLDTFAGLICYTHNQDPSMGEKQKSPLSTVTALVDRIDLHDTTLSPYQDLKMCGQVTWVGKSSMEVTMTVEQEVDERMQKMLTARFVMVARNPVTKKAAAVNPLHIEGQHEWELFTLGERNKVSRLEESQKSLLKTPPNEAEREIIHNIFLNTIDQKSGTFSIRLKPENSVWMEDTKLKTLGICHPEQRNLYSKIFGGYLMRKAYELAWANAALYCKTRPVLKVVDDIVFRKPVEIGSLLFFSSEIVYTEGPLLQVKVHAEVLDFLTGERDTTNDFYFAFDSTVPDLPSVLPRTYAESMLYLDGMRHLKD
ncbi:hypothetical protein BaRGS_00025598 [Batillaria attramentaria]|uniref:HotDog ACOT-type domain-containing protein n=1 Tax=Batillaria attramentaria TaxID=370345 RepID=A0ABD0K7Y2_9CAEN